MLDTDLYMHLLGISSPWFVSQVDLSIPDQRVEVRAEHLDGNHFTCPECATICPVYDHAPERTWRHLDSCQFKTYLKAQVPRVHCQKHGVKTVSVPWAEQKSRFTLLFERLAIDVLKACDIQSAARLLNLTWDEAHAIQQRAVARGLAKFKAATNSAHDFPVAPNLLKRNFTAGNPNEIWVTDITYLWTSEGWLYLAMILDLYSRRVVGWSMNERMTSTLVCDALRMAWFRRRRPKGVIVHSDRGSQYCGKDFQRLLKKYGMLSSMSRKGDCWDNAVAESLFHSIKVESIHGEVFGTREAMRKEVFEYIEAYYNRARLHSTLGYKTPEQFEQCKAA